MVGKILAVNVSAKKGIHKTPMEEGFFKVGHGLIGDAHAGNWHRQVSLFGIESIKKMKEHGIEGLCTRKFVENLTTEGIALYKLPVGTKLQIGDTVQEVTQIGKECHISCAVFEQIGSCVMPTESIFTKVLKDGTVRPGDTIKVLD